MTARKKKNRKAYSEPAPDKGKTVKVLRSRHLLAFSVSIITFLLYITSLQNNFVNWDDSLYIYENPNIRSINANFFRWAFAEFYASNWHPLTWISHAVDYAVWGLNPPGHHLTSILLHAANTYLVIVLLMRLLVIHRRKAGESEATAFPNDRGILIAGGFAGLLFGIAPVHVESVAWISERKDLLCALFFILSILMYVRHADTADNEILQKNSLLPRLNRHYLLSLAFFALALMAKPMAVSLPVVLLILDWFLFKNIKSLRSFSSALTGKMLFIVLSVISSILTILAQKAGGAVVDAESLSFSTRILVAFRSLTFYLREMILPINLSPFYPHPKEAYVLSPEYGMPVLIVAGITLFCIFTPKKQRMWMALWGYYLVTLLPVLGIVQVGSQAMADRYTYLPSLGPFLLIGLLVAWISGRIDSQKKWGMKAKLLVALAAILVLVPMSYLTFKQVQIWKDSITLWNSVIEKYPEAALAYNNRGMAKQKQNDFSGALADFNKAIDLSSNYEKAYNNRGILRQKLGDYAGAIKDYDKAVELRPAFVEAYSNRGIAKAMMKDYTGAIKDFDLAVDANPGHPDILFNRGLAKFMSDNVQGACEDWGKALQLGSHPAEEKIMQNCRQR